jgi:hypothetical protein
LAWKNGLEDNKRAQHIRRSIWMDLKAFPSNILYDPASYTSASRGYLARCLGWEDSWRLFVDNVLFEYNYSLFQAPSLELTSFWAYSGLLEQSEAR